jgi:predicted transcriptional regulator
MEENKLSHYTLEQKLDRILQLLKVRAFAKSIEPKLQNPMSISLILNSNFGVTDNDEVEYITKILLDDGHIEPDKSGITGLYSITRKGQKFVDEVGYEKGRIDIDNKRVIDRLTIKSLRRSKTSLWISILALIISALALLFDKIF